LIVIDEIKLNLIKDHTNVYISKVLFRDRKSYTQRYRKKVNFDLSDIKKSTHLW